MITYTHGAGTSRKAVIDLVARGEGLCGWKNKVRLQSAPFAFVVECLLHLDPPGTSPSTLFRNQKLALLV